jgi:hypothetical protein
MRCCDAEFEVRGGSPGRSWRSAGTCFGSGTMVILMPKCPACIAAYLALWMGAGVATSVAGHLRFVMAGVFFASLIWFVLRPLLATMPWAGVGRKGGHEKSV